MTIKSAVVRHPSLATFLKDGKMGKERKIKFFKCSSRGPIPFPFGLSHAFGSYFRCDLAQTISEYSLQDAFISRCPSNPIPKLPSFIRPGHFDPQHFPLLSMHRNKSNHQRSYSNFPFLASVGALFYALVHTALAYSTV